MSKVVVLDLEMITEAYNAAAKQYVINCFNELEYKSLDRILLDRFCKCFSGDQIICDIGCGPGEIANYIDSKGKKVVGIDISENMIEEAKKLSPNIDFKVGDMFSLDIADSMFQGITSFYAIVNFSYKDIKSIFDEYYRVLNNSGLLLISFHTGENRESVPDFFGSGKPLDFYYLNENKILNLLKTTGFEVEEAIVRFPYKEEYQSKRAYVLAKKSQ